MDKAQDESFDFYITLNRYNMMILLNIRLNVRTMNDDGFNGAEASRGDC